MVTCGFPQCSREAVELVSGRDFDGTDFDESCCAPHAGYLFEHAEISAAQGRAMTSQPLSEHPGSDHDAQDRSCKPKSGSSGSSGGLGGVGS